MATTDKDVFIQLRASKHERTLLKAMARRRGLDASKLVMKWYRNELKACKKAATECGKTLDVYLKLDK